MRKLWCKIFGHRWIDFRKIMNPSPIDLKMRFKEGRICERCNEIYFPMYANIRYISTEKILKMFNVEFTDEERRTLKNYSR